MPHDFEHGYIKTTGDVEFDPVYIAEKAVLTVVDDAVQMMIRTGVTPTELAEKLAEILGEPKGSVTHFLKADQNVSIIRLCKIAHALGCDFIGPRIVPKE